MKELLIAAGLGFLVFEKNAYGSVPAIPLVVPKLAVDALKKCGVSDSSVWFRFDDLFLKWGSAYGVHPDWLKAQACVESTLGQDSRTKNGLVSFDGLSYGLMQVTIRTGSLELWPKIPEAEKKGMLFGPSVLKDNSWSIRLAAMYLQMMSKEFPGDERKIILAYNQGPGNTRKGNDSGYYKKVSKWLGIIRASKTNGTFDLTSLSVTDMIRVDSLNTGTVYA